MLTENTLFGITDKVSDSIALLKKHEPEQGYRLAFSGGKDSICIYRLALMAGVKFEAHYNWTTVDPPELTRFIKKEYSRVIFNRPEKSMFKLILEKGPPRRNRRWCCSVLKERNPINSVVITGIRAEESARRKSRKEWEKATMIKNTWFLHPIMFWTELDVWDFIEMEKLKYCSLYDEGFDRIGCILCPMTRMVTIDSERWPKMVNAYKINFKRFWDRKEKENPKAVTGWTDFEHFWKWWLDRDAKKINLKQMDLFKPEKC